MRCCYGRSGVAATALAIGLLIAPAGCSSKHNADAEACELFVPAFSAIYQEILVGELGDVFVDLANESVVAATQALATAPSSELSTSLEAYIEHTVLTVDGLTGLANGGGDSLVLNAQKMGDTGSWILDHCEAIADK